MIDSHCHLDSEPLINNFEEVMQWAKNVGIEKILTICTTNKNFSEVENLVKKRSNNIWHIWYTPP